MVKSLEEKLTEFLKTGGEWERRPTTIPSIFILRMPGMKNIPARLAVELNPSDEAGRPTKKRGLVLRSKADMEKYRILITNEKLPQLLETIDKLSPPTKPQLRKDVIEI